MGMDAGNFAGLAGGSMWEVGIAVELRVVGKFVGLTVGMIVGKLASLLN